MAAMIVVLGSLLGAATALVAWLAFGVPGLLALTIWIGSGPLSALIAVALGMRPQAPQANASAQGLARA